MFHPPTETIAANRSQELINVIILFAVLETVFVGLYFVSRARSKTANGLDTYLIGPAALLCFSHIIISCYGLKYAGNGKHFTTATIQEIQTWMKLILPTGILYPLSVLLPKLSILCLYLRLFQITRYRYVTFGLAAILVLLCLATIIITFLMCTPLAYTWDKTIPGGHCIDEQGLLVWISFPNIVTDVLMLILPLPIIWKLHITPSQKLGLAITFTTFSAGLVTSILRFRTFFVTPIFLDPTWNVVDLMIWTIAEPGSYLIAACLPALRPLFGPLFKKIDLKSLRSNILRYGSKNTSPNRNTRGHSESEHWYEPSSKSSAPRVSDGNDQNGLVACYCPESSDDFDIEQASQREAHSGVPATCVEKGYRL